MTLAAPVPILSCADALGEVPVWCWRTQRLWWVDVLTGRLHRHDPAAGAFDTWDLPFRRLGSIALRTQGGLLLATDTGLHGFDPETGVCTPLVNPIAGQPAMRLNDGRADRAGRFWVGSMNDSAFVPEGRLFRIEPDLRVTVMREQLIVPNSIAFSPDDRTFYFADTRRHTLWAADFDLQTGALSNQRVFAQTAAPARPDGACIDADGYLWSASYAGAQLIRYSPDGQVDRMVNLPVRYPTCCCFGGPGLRTLFITSARFPLAPEEAAGEPAAGALFAFEPGCAGLPEPVFAG